MRTALSIIIVLGVLWFAIANAAVITVHLFIWDVTASLALIVAVSALLGFLLGILRLTPRFWRGNVAARANKAALAETRAERDRLVDHTKKLEDALTKSTPTQ